MFPCLKPIDDLSAAFGVRLTVLSLRAVIWLLRTPWVLSLTVATPLHLVFLVFCMSAGSHFYVSQTNLKRLSEACHQHRNSSCSRACFCSSISILPMPLLKWLMSANSSVFNNHRFSHVRLFVTPWIAACQASLSSTNSRSSLRLTSIELVMLSSHLILCRPLHGWTLKIMLSEVSQTQKQHCKYASTLHEAPKAVKCIEAK